MEKDKHLGLHIERELRIWAGSVSAVHWGLCIWGPSDCIAGQGIVNRAQQPAGPTDGPAFAFP